MSDPVYKGGGFGDAVDIRERMSESLQRQLALNDAKEQREIALAERERQIAADAARERAIASLVAQAAERGDAVTLAQRADGRGLGRLPSEFVRERAALMDAEDARAEAEERAAFRRWQLAKSAESTFDSSDVEAERAKWAAHHEEFGPRVAAKRERKRETAKMIRADRRLRAQGLGGV
jgi:hypothetical protein